MNLANAESAVGLSSVRPLMKKLYDMFPVFQEVRPLAVGIHKTLFAKLPDVPQNRLRQALTLHTSSTRYLKALACGELRYDLDGQPAGSVTKEQRQQASQELRERFRRDAERRRQEQLVLARKAKLVALTEKFGRR